MGAKFEMGMVRGKPVELVLIDVGIDAAPKVATDLDRSKYAAEYAAFKKGSAPAELVPIPAADVPLSQMPEPPKALMEAWEASTESDEHKAKKKHHK